MQVKFRHKIKRKNKEQKRSFLEEFSFQFQIHFSWNTYAGTKKGHRPAALKKLHSALQNIPRKCIFPTPL